MLSDREKLIRRILRWGSLGLLLLLAVSWWFKGGFPDPDEANPELLRPPRQTPTSRKLFVHQLNDHEYMVEPVAEYDAAVLVVSTNSTWRVMFAASGESNIDTPDLGVIWDTNLTSGDLDKIRFTSGEFTLYATYGRGTKIYPEAMGNIHVLAANDDVYDDVTDLRPGDQIRLHGALVNYYRTDWGPNWRKSSLVRTDTGNGACEVMFVDRVEVIERGTPVWYLLFQASFWLLILALLGQLALFIRSITRPRPKQATYDGPYAMPQADLHNPAPPPALRADGATRDPGPGGSPFVPPRESGTGPTVELPPWQRPRGS